MSLPTPVPRQHSHTFFIASAANEKNIRRVVILTAVMMIAEIIGGGIFRSMALMADGFHMGTHAFALGVTLLTYWYARRNASNPVFSFGTGKVNDLGGYTSAILLLVVAVIMAYESVRRFLQPVAIQFNEAIIVACIGLGVNLLSAWILRDRHDHEHTGSHPDREHAHRDHNIKAAYLHVLADALTSILAIVALLLGKSLGWVWMDPVMGVVGSIVISRWSIGLLRETSGILLDKVADSELVQQIRKRIEEQDEVNDIHLWEISPGRYSVILSVHSRTPKPVEHYKAILGKFPDIVHSTVEVTTPLEEETP